MYHLAAYFEAIDNTTDTDVSAAVDDILTIQNSHFVLSQEMALIAAAAMSATLTRARLASPSMRQIANPFIRPVIAAAVPPTNPNVWLLDNNPFRIPPWEEIQLLATSAVAMGSEDFTAFLWLSAGLTRAPVGNVIPLRWTSSTAAVADTWTTLTATFTDTIPSGVYTIVGTEHFSTTGRGHRWIVSNQMWRPGMLSFAAESSRQPYAMSLGQFGAMGSFRSNDLPRPQVLCGTTDNSHVGYLHVVRTGNL